MQAHERSRSPHPAAPKSPRPDAPAPAPSTLKLALAFAAVYVIWGSTYLAIRIAIESIPPFTMAGLRFLVAGLLLYGWAVLLGSERPSRRHLVNTAVAGALLLLAGNGAVVWAEQWVASGLVALLVAVVPLWMVLVDWLWGGGPRPGPVLVGGLLWGLVGVGLLVSGSEIGAAGPRDLAGGLVVLLGGLAWAVGSIHARRVAMPARPRMGTALQMLWGGLFLLIAGGVAGEWVGIDSGAVTPRSALALAYLVVFGSLVGFSAYIWLLRVSTPARVSTYAYVNPVVALALGWALADEPLTGRTLMAAFVILSAVAVITLRGRPRRPVRATEGPAAD